MNIQIFPTSWLLWIILQWPWEMLWALQDSIFSYFGYIPEMRFLVYTIILFLTFWGTYILLSQVATPFYIPTSNVESSDFSISLPILIFCFLLFYLALLTAVKRYFTVVCIPWRLPVLSKSNWLVGGSQVWTSSGRPPHTLCVPHRTLSSSWDIGEGHSHRAQAHWHTRRPWDHSPPYLLNHTVSPP